MRAEVLKALLYLALVIIAYVILFKVAIYMLVIGACYFAYKTYEDVERKNFYRAFGQLFKTYLALMILGIITDHIHVVEIFHRVLNR